MKKQAAKKKQALKQELDTYETMYFKLAAKVADAIDLLQNIQKDCEEIYIMHGPEKHGNP